MDEQQAARQCGGCGPREALTPMVPEFRYKVFSFTLGDDGECEPKRVGEYLTDNAAGGWLPKSVSELVQDGKFIVSVLLVRARPRKVVPVLGGE